MFEGGGVYSEPRCNYITDISLVFHRYFKFSIVHRDLILFMVFTSYFIFTTYHISVISIVSIFYFPHIAFAVHNIDILLKPLLPITP